MSNEQKNLSSAASLLASASNNVDFSYQPYLVFPGDDLSERIMAVNKDKSSNATTKIGPGLKLRARHTPVASSHSSAAANESDATSSVQLVAEAVGILRYRAPSHYWVETNKKKYSPRVGDQVVGVIEERGGDFYTVNIFSGTHCILNRLSFEGATKRNKPELRKGDVVYARVEHAVNSGSDCELSCLSAAGASKKEWTTGETIYGELPQGLLLRLSLDQARSLLLPDCTVLNALSRYFLFEVAVGMNGAVWLRCNTGNNSIGSSSGIGLVETVVVRNAILNAEHLNEAQTEAMVEKLASYAKRGR